MQYEQRNPVPLPASGSYESVKATIDTVFDWQYELRKQNLLALYEKGKALAWNANDLDWSTDVNLERMISDRVANGLGPMMNTMLNPPQPLDDKRVMEFQLNMNAFMLSQFLHGEQGALLATAKIVQSVPWEEAKFYAANRSPTRRGTSRSITATSPRSSASPTRSRRASTGCSTTSSRTRAGTSPSSACRSWSRVSPSRPSASSACRWPTSRSSRT